MPENEDQTKRIGDTFDHKVALLFGHAINEALEKHPELRSVTVVFDWVGKLNDGALGGIWNDRSGWSIDPGNRDAIAGSMEQLAKMWSHQSSAALRVVGEFDRAIEKRLAVLKRTQELEDEQADKESEAERSGEEGQDDLGSQEAPGD